MVEKMDSYTVMLWVLGAIGLFINAVSVYLILKSLKYFGDEFRNALKFLTVSIIGFCAMAVYLGLLVTYEIDHKDILWVFTLVIGFIASIFFLWGARKLLSMMKKIKIK
jgi:hypothetical protein